MRLPDINDLIQDLQLAKDIAIKNEQANALVTAVMAQAKLLGIDNSTMIDITPVNNKPDLSQLTDDELKVLARLTEKVKG